MSTVRSPWHFAGLAPGPAAGWRGGRVMLGILLLGEQRVAMDGSIVGALSSACAMALLGYYRSIPARLRPCSA